MADVKEDLTSTSFTVIFQDWNGFNRSEGVKLVILCKSFTHFGALYVQLYLIKQPPWCVASVDICFGCSSLSVKSEGLVRGVGMSSGSCCGSDTGQRRRSAGRNTTNQSAMPEEDFAI